MEKTLLDFQKDWEKLVDKGFAEYTSLTAKERIWFNTECLIGTVANGGIIGHYCNYGAEYNFETIEDLNTLGFAEVSQLLLELNKWFPNGTPQYDIMERNKTISGWSESEIEPFLGQLDLKFSEKMPKLEEALVKFIIDNKLSS